MSAVLSVTLPSGLYAPALNLLPVSGITPLMSICVSVKGVSLKSAAFERYRKLAFAILGQAIAVRLLRGIVEESQHDTARAIYRECWNRGRRGAR